MTIKLTILESPEGVSLTEKEQVFDSNGGTIGRARNNTWVLPDPNLYLSGNHFRITQKSGDYFLTDTSTNGTFINGSQESLGKGYRVQLNDGDELMLGDYKLVINFLSELSNKQTELSIPSVEQPVNNQPSNNTENSGDPKSSFQAQVSVPKLSKNQTQEFLNVLSEQEEKEKILKQKNLKLTQELALVNQELNQIKETKKASSSEAFDIDLVDLTLVESMGIGHHELSDKKIKEINKVAGKVIREVVKGMLQLVLSRNKVKHVFSMNVTKIQPIQNNPLKFSLSLDEAVANMFVAKGDSYTPPVETVIETFENIVDHEEAMLSAIEHAFDQILSKLEVKELDKSTREFLNQEFSSAYQTEIKVLAKRRKNNLQQRPCA